MTFTSTPLKPPTPLALLWTTRPATICIQTTPFSNHMLPSFLHSHSVTPIVTCLVLIGISSSLALLFYSYQEFFFSCSLVWLGSLDDTKIALPSICSTFFPVLFCNFIVLKKMISLLDPTWSFSGLHPVFWELPLDFSINFSPPHMSVLSPNSRLLHVYFTEILIACHLIFFLSRHVKNRKQALVTFFISGVEHIVVVEKKLNKCLLWYINLLCCGIYVSYLNEKQ